jgi:hypothetical protein
VLGGQRIALAVDLPADLQRLAGQALRLAEIAALAPNHRQPLHRGGHVLVLVPVQPPQQARAARKCFSVSAVAPFVLRRVQGDLAQRGGRLGAVGANQARADPYASRSFASARA